MSHTREMLESTEAGAALAVAEFAAAIDACLGCVQACTSCANACLGEDDIAAMRHCIALDQNCADICAATARVLSRPVDADPGLLRALLEACVRACSNCAEECARHAEHHHHCAICEEACRDCLQACTAVL
jgi:hypothetical protein